jgi:hypothetical protein
MKRLCLTYLLLISEYRMGMAPPKDPTNTLTYDNSNLVTLLHCHKFQPSERHPHGVLIHLLSGVNKIHL